MKKVIAPDWLVTAAIYSHLLKKQSSIMRTTVHNLIVTAFNLKEIIILLWPVILAISSDIHVRNIFSLILN